MLRLRFFACFSLAILSSLIESDNNLCAKQSRKTASKATSQMAVVDDVSPAQWFDAFDAIQLEAQVPARQRARGAVLMMRAIAGVSEPHEYEQANEILQSAAARYRRAVADLKRLPRVPAVELVRERFIDWFNASAKLCEDCITLRTVDAAQKRYRRITPEEIDLLIHRKKLLDELQTTCLWTEAYVRSRQGIALTRKGAEM